MSTFLPRGAAGELRQDAARICSENIEELLRGDESKRIRLSAHIRELAAAVICAAETEQTPDGTYIRDSKFPHGDIERAGSYTGITHGSYITAAELRRAYLSLCPFFSDSKWKSELRSELCSYLAEMLGDGGMSRLTPEGVTGLPYSGSDGLKVSYVRNSYSDAAFDRFAELLLPTSEPPGRIESEDISSACDDAEDGRAAFCILPLENTESGRLGGARRLILGYGLRIAHTVTLTQSGMVFALLKKNLCMLQDCGGELRYEFTVDGGESGRLPELLAAAEYFGLSVRKIDSVPSPHSGGGYLHDVILCPGSGDALTRLSAFVLYLILEFPGYTAVGLYRSSEA